MTDDYNPDIESREEYYNRIETSADVIQDTLTDDPDAELSELVFEEADSSRVAMYPHEALSALKFSDNEPDEWQHFVRDGDQGDYSAVLTAMGFSLYRVDLWEELSRRGVDD